MKYTINHIPLHKQRRSGRNVIMDSITIHSTANPKSTAINERNWLVNPSNTRNASWHIAVDDKECVEAIPLNEQAYHSGSSKGNNSSIGIEICESGNRKQTIQNAIELVAKMLHERNWNISNLRRHFDWSGKNCPNIMSANNWADWHKFKADVKKELDKLTKPSTPVIGITPDVWAKDDWEWATKEGYMDGTRPKDNLTRQEMAIIIKRIIANGKK